MGKDLTSIIILSYNTDQYNQLCIESIREYTEPGTYEIIVIDNASKDGSVSWLKKQADVKLICNKTNKGFPKGCNQGLAVAKGSELLLLNSDTIVTKNWLTNLRTALYSSKKIGAVSCVTNFCSNGQQIEVPYHDIEGMHGFAAEYNATDPNKWELRTTLVGFCYLFKREILENVGLLDEAYTPGNYEDDDYSIRILEHGYDLLLCYDTFIHHFGSASFVQSNNPEVERQKKEKYIALLKRNEDFFQSRWHLPLDYKRLKPDYLKRILMDGKKERMLDKNKICFISSVNNEAKYTKSLAVLKKLFLPVGMTVEYRAIRGARSMTEAYQAGMLQSDAKYKIYLHQDVWIMNPLFLYYLLHVFQKYPACGVAGVVGCEQIPASAVWWEGKMLGAITDSHEGFFRNYQYINDKDSMCAEAVDGLIIATQYDLPWRVDIFDKWHFYDLSQCMEFKRHGYGTRILSQKYPWCVHDCGFNPMNGYEEEKNKFLMTYKNF